MNLLRLEYSSNIKQFGNAIYTEFEHNAQLYLCNKLKTYRINVSRLPICPVVNITTKLADELQHPSVDVDAFTTTNLSQSVTLTFDLQNLTKVISRGNEYSR